MRAHAIRLGCADIGRAFLEAEVALAPGEQLEHHGLDLATHLPFELT
jgi:hypothetical protein